MTTKNQSSVWKETFQSSGTYPVPGIEIKLSLLKPVSRLIGYYFRASRCSKISKCRVWEKEQIK